MLYSDPLNLGVQPVRTGLHWCMTELGIAAIGAMLAQVHMGPESLHPPTSPKLSPPPMRGRDERARVGQEIPLRKREMRACLIGVRRELGFSTAAPGGGSARFDLLKDLDMGDR